MKQDKELTLCTPAYTEYTLKGLKVLKCCSLISYSPTQRKGLAMSETAKNRQLFKGREYVKRLTQPLPVQGPDEDLFAFYARTGDWFTDKANLFHEFGNFTWSETEWFCRALQEKLADQSLANDLEDLDACMDVLNKGR